jgi:hypothetical protein
MPANAFGHLHSVEVHAAPVAEVRIEPSRAKYYGVTVNVIGVVWVVALTPFALMV